MEHRNLIRQDTPTQEPVFCVTKNRSRRLHYAAVIDDKLIRLIRLSLKSFVTKDMRNYANAKFFVVDAACIEESGNDFTLALQSFQMMFSARIIVILSGCEDVNGEVQRLLSIGVVNLVTGETMEDALDELTEALSEDGMQRYVVKAPVYEQPVSRHEKAPEPDEMPS